jgi:hypothetical protein
MHIAPYIVLGSAVVGLLVGLTGAGGGADAAGRGGRALAEGHGQPAAPRIATSGH